MGSGFPMKGAFHGALDTPRSDEMGGSMAMSSLPQSVSDIQPLRGPYSHMSHNSASFAPQRAVHSSAGSFHSENQGFDGRFGGSMDISSGFGKLQLNDGGFQSGVQRPAYLPHASYDGSFQRLRYPSTADDNSYQAVTGYGIESAPDLSFAYQTGKSQVGDSDSISSDYTRMESPFYAAEAGAHFRNGSSGRLSDGQAVALERKLRGIPQEADFGQSANPLQRLQFPAYDFAGYQAARLNALSGFYPVAHLGGLGATSMVPRAHRDQDPNQVVRSPLLEEFRANSKGNKRYELKVCRHRSPAGSGH